MRLLGLVAFFCSAQTTKISPTFPQQRTRKCSSYANEPTRPLHCHLFMEKRGGTLFLNIYECAEQKFRLIPSNFRFKKAFLLGDMLI
jgi:hypothetical protein